MLLIARDAVTKIGKHAWNVYPQECFGYLVGRRADGELHAALPCSRTARQDEYGDRWSGIGEHLDAADAVAGSFGMEVVGFYASAERGHGPRLDTEAPSQASPLRPVLLLYRPSCCHACSGYDVYWSGRRLRPDDCTMTRGRRIAISGNHKRILRAWRALIGEIDYSNCDRPAV